MLVENLPLTHDLKVGMIHIPEIGQVAPRQGTVLAIGPKVSDVKVGDRVFFSKYSGSTIGEKQRLILRERDLIAAFE